MTRTQAIFSCLVFSCLVPGTVVGLVPWVITRWHNAGAFFGVEPLRFLGGLLVCAGALVVLHAILRFALEGFGTPAPVAPTNQLVIGGPYRFVRNPMYVAVICAIVGQALLLGQVSLLLYAAGTGLLQAFFVRFHEEPALLSRYGDQYRAYREAVPGWLPRLTPWRGDR